MVVGDFPLQRLGRMRTQVAGLQGGAKSNRIAVGWLEQFPGRRGQANRDRLAALVAPLCERQHGGSQDRPDPAPGPHSLVKHNGECFSRAFVRIFLVEVQQLILGKAPDELVTVEGELTQE